MLLPQTMQLMRASLRCGRPVQMMSYSVSVGLRRACSTRTKLVTNRGSQDSTIQEAPPAAPEARVGEDGTELEAGALKGSKGTATKRKADDRVNPDSNTQGKEAKPNNRSPSKKKKRSNPLEDHIATEPPSVQSIISAYSNHLGKRKVKPLSMYIISEPIAERVIKAMGPAHNHVPHIELGAGPGVLTRAMLSAGIQNINCFETNKTFIKCLTELSLESNGAVRVTPLNILNLSKIVGASQLGDNSRLKKCLRDLQHRPWDDPEPCVRLVGVAHISIFFRYLVRSVMHREHFFQYGRPELVVFITESEFQKLTAVPDSGARYYRPGTIVSQLLFDIEMLDRVPTKCFYPWMAKRKQGPAIDSDMVLVRYSPKIIPGVDPSDVPKLGFFVYHCGAYQQSCVIRQLEEWVPGCGPRLISRGLEVFTPFRSLTPPDVLGLFQEFMSWPEYPGSSFHAAAEQSTLAAEDLEEHDVGDMLPSPEDEDHDEFELEEGEGFPEYPFDPSE